jgi:hypothetical protein
LLQLIDFLISARTAIRHGVMRVLKMGVDVVWRYLHGGLTPLPLAGGGFIFIRCPDIL